MFMRSKKYLYLCFMSGSGPSGLPNKVLGMYILLADDTEDG